MLRRFERIMKVYSPATDETQGEGMGYYPVSLTLRTSEEIASEDVLYSNVRYIIYGKKHNAPDGGYRRGMILEDMDGARYHVLVPILVGRCWIMKAERVMENGDSEK